MKRYKYRKVNPEMFKLIKQLRKDGISYTEIGKELKLSSSTVSYHLNPKDREETIKRAKKSYKRLTKEELRERGKRDYPKKKEYYKKRYHEDEEFRKYFIGLVGKSFKKRREIWLANGLCSICGKERKNEELKLCERCRKMRRRRYNDEKNRKS